MATRERGAAAAESDRGGGSTVGRPSKAAAAVVAAAQRRRPAGASRGRAAGRRSSPMRVQSTRQRARWHHSGSWRGGSPPPPEAASARVFKVCREVEAPPPKTVRLLHHLPPLCVHGHTPAEAPCPIERCRAAERAVAAGTLLRVGWPRRPSSSPQPAGAVHLPRRTALPLCHRRVASLHPASRRRRAASVLEPPMAFRQVCRRVTSHRRPPPQRCKRRLLPR
jgi:hypothetical protein